MLNGNSKLRSIILRGAEGWGGGVQSILGVKARQRAHGGYYAESWGVENICGVQCVRDGSDTLEQ